ncbi:MAG TPA: hypothetical protein DCS43_05455, partial [Verrucomicrobia bacterium]|nr:hypothetical protein [Verrucomicrobiota bacterium]
ICNSESKHMHLSGIVFLFYGCVKLCDYSLVRYAKCSKSDQIVIETEYLCEKLSFLVCKFQS